MTCGGCGRANREGATFCAGCGSRLPAGCGACGAPLADGARFCDACGAPVGETRSPEAAAAVRKVVTILFADLSGSTALQERLDAETTRRVMDRVHRLLADAVAAHAGRVVKFTGDGLMAVF
ncbi:MAG: zinc-ribbon domain-containing protein, partial [Actinobacteria bacterium]